MASIAPPTFPSPSSARSDTNPQKLFVGPKFTSRFKRSNLASRSLSRVLDSSTICRCQNNNGSIDGGSPSPSDESRRWESSFHENVRNAIKWLDSCVKYGFRDQSKAVTTEVVVEREGVVVKREHVDDEEWDWERWKKHFAEVDEQERVVSILKSQLTHAINKEDYEDAARLKVAIAAAATNDTVGRVISQLNKAIEDERYLDAAYVRDYAGAGLVGWWAGISDDSNDPYGRIIRITAEHGRYVARSYSPRQLATAADGAPLFEIFLTVNERGEYKQQGVYLKRSEVHQNFPIASPKSLGLTSSLNPLEPLGDKGDMFMKSTEDTEDGEDRDDDSDIAEGSAFESILRDMIPGAKDLKVKVLNVTTPGKIDRDLISKVVEQIMEEEDDEKDSESESVDSEEEVKGETDEEQNEIEMGAGSRTVDGEEKSQIAVKVVVGGLVQKLSSGTSRKDLLRVPAKLEKKGRLSFSFSIEKDDRQVSGDDAQSLLKIEAKVRGKRSVDRVMLDLAKSIGRGKIPMKVLKDVSQLINLTLNQAQNRQPLSGSTTFNRIEFPASADPLNALYVGAHGLYTSEVIQLRSKFGQWKEDGSTKEVGNLEFYEYVEAVKLTGDPYVPAGQVAFRAKVGTQYHLPHKGIIPEEFGVIARYRGQGRLAEPGFKNPRWVDGELVILDGKYINGGPVVGFVYWAPEYHFLVFFNQLRLQE